MGSRIAALPIDHLEAELCAYPLSSEAAFEQNPVELCPGLEQAKTYQLWRRAEKELLGTWPGVSLDECVAMRDRLWFLDRPAPLHKNIQPVSLVKYLRGLASRTLRQHGSTASPHLVPGPGEPFPDRHETRARNAWRWLSFALPSDLLLAGLHQGHQSTSPHTVKTITPALERLLADRGYAETHLHLWAALEFPSLWVTTQRALAQTQLGAGEFKGPGACFDEGAGLGPWLLRAAVARYLLAAFLDQRGDEDDFRKYTQKQTLLIQRTLGAGRTAVLGNSLDELAHGQLDGKPEQDFATLRSIYRRMIRPVSKFPQEVKALWGADPIAPLVPWSPDRGTSPEIGFLCRGFEYLEELEASGHKDRPFALLFWQVVRVRNLFFRHVVHRPMTPGLQWFIRTFRRMKPGRRPVTPRLQLLSAADLCGQGRGLKSLEVRTSPEDSFRAMVALVRDFQRPFLREGDRGELQTSQPPATAYGAVPGRGAQSGRHETLQGDEAHGSAFHGSPWPDLEVGIVFHLPRNRRGGWARGRPSGHWRGSHADPSYDVKKPRTGNPTGFRYARFYRNRRREARALARTLTTFPSSLQIVRGIDVCADEQGIPVWVLAPLIRLVHDAGEQAEQVLRRCFAHHVPALRKTVHAGEDFTHLLTGLRRLDESIEAFRLRSGDRLGHALALGLEPGRWAERAGRILVSREKRLLDLAWEWSWYARQGTTPAGRREQMEREIAIHSKDLFGRELTPMGLEAFRDALYDEGVLRRLGFPDRQIPPQGGRHRQTLRSELETEDLVLRYLTSHEMFCRGRETVRVDPLLEVEALSTLQNGLRRKTGQLGLVIEINPSSNLLIGHLEDLRQHPLWRLKPPGEPDGIPPLEVCVGSDDPLMFGARLDEEYQLLHDALLMSGHSEAEAQQWLDSARQAGLKARFTLAGTPRKIEPWVFGGEPPLTPPP